MSAFVKLTLHDGRDVAWPIADIREVVEPVAEEAAKEFRSGCTRVYLRDGIEDAWVLGDVDHVLPAIRDAEKEGTS